jgi:Sulfatase
MGCYGSPIATPNIDALAKSGLLFNNMHTTALCSPTRSCVLTGRNHHSNAMSCITEGSTGFPGGNGNIPSENGMLSEMLLQKGYNTFALGKWHLTPADQMSAAGPYDRGRLGAASSVSMGSSAATPTNIIPSSFMTITASSLRRLRSRVIISAKIWKRIGFLPFSIPLTANDGAHYHHLLAIFRELLRS